MNNISNLTLLLILFVAIILSCQNNIQTPVDTLSVNPRESILINEDNIDEE